MRNLGILLLLGMGTFILIPILTESLNKAPKTNLEKKIKKLAQTKEMKQLILSDEFKQLILTDEFLSVVRHIGAEKMREILL